MTKPNEKLQARGGDMGDDTDAFLAWLDSLPKEPNDTVKAAYAAYKAAVRPAAHDLMAELVEALRGARWRMKQYDYQAMQPELAAIDAALAKIKEPQT